MLPEACAAGSLAAMTRTLFSGGSIFDGTGAAVGQADLAVENGRVVEIGPGLDGDARVDVTGKTILPGLFDCHTHVTFSHIDTMRRIQAPDRKSTRLNSS